MINVIVLVGRLAADPELRRTKSDVPVCTFRLAVDREYVREGQQRQADFIDIVCWRNKAEFAAKYFRKGMMAAVQGSLQTRSYEDSNGVKRRTVEVMASGIHFAEPKRSSQSEQQEQRQPGAYQPPVMVSDDDFIEIPPDDELPF